jgi:hypothetical protein
MVVSADWNKSIVRLSKWPAGYAEAAIIMLPPIAAAAIGIMTFEIEFQIVEHAGV